MAWKTARKFFHDVENPDFRPPPPAPAYGSGFPIQTARLVAGSDKSPPSDQR